MTEYRQPIFGSDGEPCASCGAPLASDQRYCLSCGARRGAARLPFRDILQKQAATTTELMPVGTPVGGYGVIPPDGGTVNDRLRRNAPLMALIGILLLAMLIGVLLGHWAGDNPPAAAASQPRPQIIQVGGGAAAAPAAAAPAATTPTEATATTDTTASSSSSSDSGSASSPAAAKSTNKSVKNLDKLSGKAYQKQIDKLGKKISTGGKPPPKDNKPAAGGGSFEDIG
jgi:hypothetical protein